MSRSKKKGSDGNALGVPRRKTGGSVSGSKSSAKKRPGFPPTPSRAPAQAPKKPTQRKRPSLEGLDKRSSLAESRINGLIQQVKELTSNTSHALQASSVRNEELEKRITALESRLPAPEVVEGQKWKVGDYAMVTNTDPMGFSSGSLVRVESVGKSTACCVLAKNWQLYTGIAVRLSDLRLATPKEVQAHLAEQERLKKEEEWAAVTELQPNDWTERTPNVEGFIRNHDIPVKGPSALREYGVGWICDAVMSVGEGYCPAAKLSNVEWIRRARGTIAQKKREREEEERNKPLEPGMKIKHAGAEHAIYLAQQDSYGRHIIASCVHGIWAARSVLRSEFTITSPDQRPANT